MNIHDSGPLVRGHVTFTTTDDVGNVIAVVEADNAFTDAYAALLAQVIGSGGSPAMPATHMSLGTGTGDTSHTATAVTGGGALKALSVLSYSAPLTVTATAHWSSGEAAVVGHSAGLWGNGGTTLLAIVLQDFTKQAGFNLTISWVLTFVGA